MSLQFSKFLNLFFLRERLDLHDREGVDQTSDKVKRSKETEHTRNTYLLSGFFKLVVTALLRMKVRKSGILKYLPALTTLDTLEKKKKE